MRRLPADVKDSAPRPPALCCWMSASRCVLRAQEDGADGIWRYRRYTLGARRRWGDGYHHLYGRQHFHGAWGRKGERRDFARKSLAIIGDSTFFHSGMTGLATASYNKSNITVLIVDNSTTGMTGHQDNPATGKTLKGEYTEPLSLESVCRALGAQHIRVVDSLNIVGLQAEIKRR